MYVGGDVLVCQKKALTVLIRNISEFVPVTLVSPTDFRSFDVWVEAIYRTSGTQMCPMVVQTNCLVQNSFGKSTFSCMHQVLHPQPCLEQDELGRKKIK